MQCFVQSCKKWKPKKEQLGVHMVIIQVTDSYDSVNLTFNITVKPNIDTSTYIQNGWLICLSFIIILIIATVFILSGKKSRPKSSGKNRNKGDPWSDESE